MLRDTASVTGAGSSPVHRHWRGSSKYTREEETRVLTLKMPREASNAQLSPSWNRVSAGGLHQTRAGHHNQYRGLWHPNRQPPPVARQGANIRMVLLMTIEPDVVTIMEERPGEYMKRSVRLMMIARDLTERYHTVQALAQRYGVTERTIYRDLAQLQDEPLREPLACYNVWRSERCQH